MLRGKKKKKNQTDLNKFGKLFEIKKFVGDYEPMPSNVHANIEFIETYCPRCKTSDTYPNHPAIHKSMKPDLVISNVKFGLRRCPTCQSRLRIKNHQSTILLKEQK